MLPGRQILRFVVPAVPAVLMVRAVGVPPVRLVRGGQ